MMMTVMKTTTTNALRHLIVIWKSSSVRRKKKDSVTKFEINVNVYHRRMYFMKFHVKYDRTNERYFLQKNNYYDNSCMFLRART